MERSRTACPLPQCRRLSPGFGVPPDWVRHQATLTLAPIPSPHWPDQIGGDRPSLKRRGSHEQQLHPGGLRTTTGLSPTPAHPPTRRCFERAPRTTRTAPASHLRAATGTCPRSSPLEPSEAGGRRPQVSFESPPRSTTRRHTRSRQCHLPCERQVPSSPYNQAGQIAFGHRSTLLARPSWAPAEPSFP